MLEEEFKTWLEREKYSKNTVYNTLSSTRNAEDWWKTSPSTLLRMPVYGPVLKRYLRFLNTLPLARWSPFERFVVDHFKASAPPVVMGQRRKPDLTAEQWRSLLQAVCSSDDPTDQALCAILRSGEEPSAMLKKPLRLIEGFENVKNKTRTLADYFSTPNGAYKKVQRQLNKHAEELGLEVDFRSIARVPPKIRFEGSF